MGTFGPEMPSFGPEMLRKVLFSCFLSAFSCSECTDFSVQILYRKQAWGVQILHTSSQRRINTNQCTFRKRRVISKTAPARRSATKSWTDDRHDRRTLQHADDRGRHFSTHDLARNLTRGTSVIFPSLFARATHLIQYIDVRLMMLLPAALLLAAVPAALCQASVSCPAGSSCTGAVGAFTGFPRWLRITPLDFNGARMSLRVSAVRADGSYIGTEDD